jgi:hypothetical protein
VAFQENRQAKIIFVIKQRIAVVIHLAIGKATESRARRRNGGRRAAKFIFNLLHQTLDTQSHTIFAFQGFDLCG